MSLKATTIVSGCTHTPRCNTTDQHEHSNTVERLTAERDQARAELKEAQAENTRRLDMYESEHRRANKSTTAAMASESKLASLTQELEQLRAGYAGAVEAIRSIFPEGQSLSQWIDYHTITYEQADAIKQALSSTPQSIKDVMEAMKEMRGLLMFALWHHQGGSSEVGQPIRKFLGIGEYDHLTQEQIAEAKEAVRKLEAK